jgi:cytochrome c biogenesis protein CcmG, thiol:disulfide interchange protein DsbE
VADRTTTESRIQAREHASLLSALPTARARHFSWKWPLQAAAVGLVGVLLLLLAWRLATEQRSHGLAEAVAAGHAPPAPDFELPRLNASGTVRLSSLRGRVVLLNFWASWCIPCKDEATRLEAAWRRWHSHGVVFLGLDAQDFSSDAHHFLHAHAITYPNARDGPGNVVNRYGVNGFPETWIVSRSGRLVVEHVVGPLTPGQIDRDLSLALLR